MTYLLTENLDEQYYCTTCNKEWRILNIAPLEKTVSPGGKCTPKMNQYTFKLLTVTTRTEAASQAQGYGRDVTCVILSERGIYGSLLMKRRRLEYLAAYLCFR